MKKLLVVLLALTCLSALAFADGATVGFGFGRTQFNIASGNSISGSDIVSGWTNDNLKAGILHGGDSWPPAPRVNLDLAYSGTFTSYQLTAYINGNAMTWVNVNGTLKLVPDMFSLKIGEFDGDGFDAFRKTSPHPIRDVNNNNIGRFNGWGVIADVAPKDSGFEAALFYEVADPTGNVVTYATLNSTLGNIHVAASYTLPGMLKITAGAVPGNLFANYDRNIFGRVELLMVPNLTLWADVRYDGFDVTPAVSNINAFLAGAYAMDPLTIVLAAGYGSNDVLGTKVNAWAVYPEVYFDAGAITVGAYTAFGGSDIANSGIAIEVEPYVKLDDFNLRVSFHYITSTASGAVSRWEVPILVDWGF